MTVTIFLNTRPFGWDKPSITYKEVVDLLYGEGKDLQPSMAFHIGAYSGILLPGESVTAVDQMKINAAFTGNA